MPDGPSYVIEEYTEEDEMPVRPNPPEEYHERREPDLCLPLSREPIINQ